MIHRYYLLLLQKFIAFVIISCCSVKAMELSPEEKEYNEKNKGIILYLKDQDVDLSKVRVKEERYFFNPYRIVSPYAERPLNNRDLHSTTIRGFLLGYSSSIIDSAEVFLHNLAFHGAGQCGKQVGQDYIAPSLTFAMSQIAANYIYNCIAVTHPHEFPGRSFILSIMSNEGILKKNFTEYEKSLIENIPELFHAPARKLLADLKLHDVFIKDYMYLNVPAGETIKKVSNYMNGEKTKPINLKKLADIAQLNMYDILNNGIYAKICELITPLAKKTELVTSPLMGSLGQFAFEYFMEEKSNLINLQPIKAIINSKLDSCFKVRYPELEQRLDPVFCKLGEKYAQELVALSIEPVAKGFNMDALEFVTKKSYQNPEPHEKVTLLLSIFQNFKQLLPSKNSSPKFIGL